MKLILSVILTILLMLPPAATATDTVKYRWPVPAFAVSHDLNATFCEFRNTLSANHFHNGVDVGQSDGSPIYSGLDGVVYAYGTQATDGTSAYVRVATQVGNTWKHISYVHIVPNPVLSAGSPVTAGVTVLGTVLIGQGHVHITERELVGTYSSSGVEVNPARTIGGLTPYLDPYTPVVDRAYLLFRTTGTSTALSTSSLFGSVDIVVHVMERNGPGSAGGTQTNNGTYVLGYRLISAISATPVYVPADDGIRFRFDRKPLDSYVGYVFDQSASTTSNHVYYVTNGSGASSITSSRVVSASSWNTRSLPDGAYRLQVFAADTRGSTDTATVAVTIRNGDRTAPSSPVMRSVVADSGIRVSWYPSPEPDVKGYRVQYYATSLWQSGSVDSLMNRDRTSTWYRVPSDFISPKELSPNLSFRVLAFDSVGNESPSGDVYFGAYNKWSAHGASSLLDSILIVDGFDRYGQGGWSQPAHDFVKRVGTLFPFGVSSVSSCANEAVVDGTVDLSRYRWIFWILGDESASERTFTAAEQERVMRFLEGGGRLFLSGSNIGQDLGRRHTLSEPGDSLFYRQYLKSVFVDDGSTGWTPVTGGGGLFAGVTATFGGTFSVTSPDDIQPVGGAASVLTFAATRGDGTARTAGISFAGAFGPSATEGRLVYLSFPFESIANAQERSSLMDRVFGYFGLVVTDVEKSSGGGLPEQMTLLQNYPNPFNPSTQIQILNSKFQIIKLSVFDLLGRELAVLVNELKPAGSYTVTWNAANLRSGVYFVVLQCGQEKQIRKAVLLK